MDFIRAKRIIVDGDILPSKPGAFRCGTWEYGLAWRMVAANIYTAGEARPNILVGHEAVWIGDRTGFMNLILQTMPASSVNILRNSNVLRFRGAYWDGAKSVDRDFVVFHRMLSTTPTSEIVFQIAGVDYLRVGDGGVKLDKIVFDPGTGVSVEAGGVYTVPAGVYYVNLGPNTVAEYFSDIDNAWLVIVPAGGKGIVISDGSNARLRNTGLSVESSTIRRVL
jgi:hypothetical protein